MVLWSLVYTFTYRLQVAVSNWLLYVPTEGIKKFGYCKESEKIVRSLPLIYHHR